MSVPRNYQVQGIILKQSKLGEIDKILTLYTSEFGKLRAVAKGACRPTSKFSGNVEPLTYSSMCLTKGRSLDILTQAQTINSFWSLKGDLWRLACGLYVLELIDSFTVEGSENPALFGLLLETLNQLSQPGEGEIALRYFELHLLHHLGYRPQLQHCTVCHLPLKPLVNFFSPVRGGVICHGCHFREDEHGGRIEGTEERLSFPISVEALKVLRLWQDCDYATAKRVKVKPELSRELSEILYRHIRYLLQKKLGSRDWIEELREESKINVD